MTAKATGLKPRLHRVKDVADMLSVSEWEIRRLCDAGILHRRYIGDGSRFYRVTAASVDKYLDGLPAERVKADS